MQRNTLWPIIAAAGLLTGLPTLWAAPATPATPAAAPANPPVRGRVTAVDAATKTITLAEGRDQTPGTLLINDATHYLVDVPGAATDLKVGQTVHIYGQIDGNTITARFIQIIPPAEAAQPAGGRRGGVQGVVATIAPSLTVTTNDKQTETVTTDANTRVTTSRDGALADVKPGEFITAVTTGPAGSPVAVSLHVRSGGMRGRRAPTPPAPAAPATP